jgi:ferredoxin
MAQQLRRQFFRRLFGRGIVQLQHQVRVQAPVPARAIRAAAPFLPSRRDLLQALLVNGAGEDAALPAHPILPAGLPVMDPAACTACETCGRVCPTGALIAGETATAWVLRLNPPRCVGCGVCVESCHRGALRLAETVTADAAVRNLHVVPRRRCERCGRLYVTTATGDGCPVCRDDNDSFSAIFG